MKLLCLDGNSLAYRAFFAIPEEALTTSDGQPTNAVYGFTNMLVRLLRERKPDYVAVAFDAPTPKFRLDLDPGYKAQREGMPSSLASQMGILEEILAALHVPVLRIEGAEADDVLATLARAGKENGIEVEIVSGDRDVFQCIADPVGVADADSDADPGGDSGAVKVLYTRRGISEVDEMDAASVEVRYGVLPSKYVALAALRGDPSDNLPGVTGIGDKTAAKLLARYGTLGEIINHAGELTPKLSENITTDWDRVIKNVEIMRLVDTVNLPLEVTDLHIGRWDVDEIAKVFKALEFGSILNRTLSLADRYAPGNNTIVRESADVEITSRTIQDEAALADAVGALGLPFGIAADIPVTATVFPVVWAFANTQGDAVVATSSVAPSKTLGQILAGDSPRFCGHGTKGLIGALAHDGVNADALDVDVEVAAWLIDPARGSYPLEDLSERYLGTPLDSPKRPGQGELALGGVAESNERLAKRAWAAVALAVPLRERLIAEDSWDLYAEIERPITRILAKMEVAGIRVDADYLGELSADLAQRIDVLSDRIWTHAGHRFTINSTKQLREVLFDELGLAPQKKTKTGYSTDAATLDSLRDKHPIVECLLDYRNLEKLRSTYTDALPPLVDPADGRIHTRFRQTGAATGRLTSENPNLMNIPIRTDEGRRIRQAFVPADGNLLCSADYSQIELRVMAHLCGDEHLIEAFQAGDDIHVATSARVFGIPAAQVTTAYRNRAKVVNYGLLYGMQAWGMATRMGIDKAEAQEFIDAYFGQFPKLRTFMGRVVEQAKIDGYTTTIMGRRRWFPELRSQNPRFRQMGERQALNAPIQGSAADIIKVAMIDLDRRLIDEGLATKLLLQVHDELVLEVPEDEKNVAASLVADVMEHAVELAVPLVADVHFGTSWAQCKG